MTELGLGSAHAVPLKPSPQAPRPAREQALAPGLDPRSERSKRKVVAKSFAEAAGELIATPAAEMAGQRHHRAWDQSQRMAGPSHRDVPADRQAPGGGNHRRGGQADREALLRPGDNTGWRRLNASSACSPSPRRTAGENRTIQPTAKSSNLLRIDGSRGRSRCMRRSTGGDAGFHGQARSSRETMSRLAWSLLF